MLYNSKFHYLTNKCEKKYTQKNLTHVNGMLYWSPMVRGNLFRL